MKNPVANFARSISHAEKLGKRTFVFNKANDKNIMEMCRMLKHLNYIHSYVFITDDHSGKICIKLTGRINKVVFLRKELCKKHQLDRKAQNILPARNVGHVILTTSQSGLKTHREAIADGDSGKLLFAVF